MLAAVGHAFLPCGHAVDDLRKECRVCRCYYNAKEEMPSYVKMRTCLPGPFKGMWHIDSEMAHGTWHKSLQRFKEDEMNWLTTSDFRKLQEGDTVWKACGHGQWIHATFLEFDTSQHDRASDRAMVQLWNSYCTRYVDRYCYFWELAFLKQA